MLNITSAPVGYLKTLTMYPMDFEEFFQIKITQLPLKHPCIKRSLIGLL